MSRAVSMWDEFVFLGVRDSTLLATGMAAFGDGDSAAIADCAGVSFRLAYQALLLGAEDVGRLALACERGFDAIGKRAQPTVVAALGEGVALLRDAFDTLARPDASGARTTSLPLAEVHDRLAAALPVERGRPAPRPMARAWQPQPAPVAEPAAAPVPAAEPVPAAAPVPVPVPVPAPASASAPTPTEPAADRIWEPTVDPDMIDLFFEEANERIEDLSAKLLEIEQRPDDIELLRDIFRDLHTVKGSSAMVGLGPMNRLAHAAEDLVGQLRDRTRSADSTVIDALLAALDGLREILRLAQDRVPIDFDSAPVVRRLRDPGAAPAPAPVAAPAAEPAAKGAPAALARPEQRQTIRVDFDKLDLLMNLVGELVLGRDGLRNALQSLASVSGELSSDRHLSRRLLAARHSIESALPHAAAADPATGGGASNASAAARDTARQSLLSLGDEIGRVERVLVDISQDLDHATGRLDTVSDDLRDQVMKLRMIPVGGVFRKHHRTVRDLANSLGKRARLELHGEETELDKVLVEALDEPLMHLVRNAVDHGIELPADRVAAGKPAEGTIWLSASHHGNQMVIKIRDDGKGIDPAGLRKRALDRDLLSAEELETTDDRQILEVIFRPGFSTAEKVTEVSGRGVGMDVVKQAIVSRLKGVIDIDSQPGRGSTFTLRLPLTLAIIQVVLIRAAGEEFAIPLDSVIRTFSCTPNDVHLVQDREFVSVGGRQVPLIRLASVLELGAEPYGDHDRLEVILCDIAGDAFGLACDHLLGKKEIVIKSLGDLLEDVPCAAGATLLGERCALILDVPAIVRRAMRRGAPVATRPAAPTAVPAAATAEAPHILLVEDSDVVRESLRRLLADGGFRCTTAVDGVEALAAAQREKFDLISTDVMMPRMDGYELTRALRATPEYKDTPIVMVTSRGERIDRVRGFDAGVDEYITKPHDRQILLRVVRKLLQAHRGGGRR